jgi:hypothetical protein
MPVGEEDAAVLNLVLDMSPDFALTNFPASLIFEFGTDHVINLQGNYDYHAHAQVYTGGADPLGSQGYEVVDGHPSSS